MRTSSLTVVASVLDLILFVIAWVWQSIVPAGSGGWIHGLYFVFGAIGFILAVYGFVTLAKGGEDNLKRAGLVVLFSFIPGCAVLITVLKAVGGHPV